MDYYTQCQHRIRLQSLLRSLSLSECMKVERKLPNVDNFLNEYKTIIHASDIVHVLHYTNI